jgi:hypothetical protein
MNHFCFNWPIQRAPKVTPRVARGRCAQHLHDTRTTWRTLYANFARNIRVTCASNSRRMHVTSVNPMQMSRARGARNKGCYFWTPLQAYKLSNIIPGQWKVQAIRIYLKKNPGANIVLHNKQFQSKRSNLLQCASMRHNWGWPGSPDKTLNCYTTGCYTTGCYTCARDYLRKQRHWGKSSHSSDCPASVNRQNADHRAEDFCSSGYFFSTWIKVSVWHREPLGNMD